jgi:hypothetical protein
MKEQFLTTPLIIVLNLNHHYPNAYAYLSGLTGSPAPVINPKITRLSAFFSDGYSGISVPVLNTIEFCTNMTTKIDYLNII